MVSNGALNKGEINVFSAASVGKSVFDNAQYTNGFPGGHQIFGNKINLTALERRGRHRVRINFKHFPIRRIYDLAHWLEYVGASHVGIKQDWLWFTRPSDAMLFYLTFKGTPNGYAIKDRKNDSSWRESTDFINSIKGATKIEVGDQVAIINAQRTRMERKTFRDTSAAYKAIDTALSKVRYPSSTVFTFQMKRKSDEAQV